MSFKIDELLKGNSPLFSFEFFPPKNMVSGVALGSTLGELISLDPSFVSVTYGAGGSTQKNTFDLVHYIQNKLKIPTMAHFTCVGSTKDEIQSQLSKLKEIGIQNLMALRGDPPKGAEAFEVTEGGLAHASDLIELAQVVEGFSIGCAAYPEKHPEAVSLDADLKYLKMKVDNGASFAITQMFFDNQLYFDFIEKAKALGIHIPIIPGIMPITNYKQIKRFSEMSGSAIPREISDRFVPIQDDVEKMYELGIALAAKQCQELLDKGTPGLHFYTLNQSKATLKIYQSLKK